MSSPLEELVEKYGGVDKLSTEERNTYFDHLKVIEGKVLTIEDTKSFVRSMISQIERSLVDAPEGSMESLGLKSRLKNMLVLEGFLYSPERAAAAMKRYYEEHKDQKPKL